MQNHKEKKENDNIQDDGYHWIGERGDTKY